ncbi:STAND family AAA ATPase [Nostoc sp.]|uniref:STAND family AAA ATPase n=1 Tax=Nostoc sp. TaxID=1180 RepID=UPI002FFB5E10
MHRAKLIEKWVALELTEETDEQQIWAKIDELRLHVDSLVHKNVVPAKPFHILILLQSFETMTTQRLELTAYGHYYQYLIYQALERVHVERTEIDTYFNVLSELGGAILESPSENLDDSDLDIFFKKYSTNFLPVNQDKVIRNLVSSFILQRSETGLKFRYRYLFYFFAAKKLADSLHRGEEAKKRIKHLVNTIHLEKASNIVLFLTHHSKDPWILDEILLSVMDIFYDEKEVTLEASSLSFLQNFVQEIPDLVLENRDARQERLEDDRQKDLIEQHEDENSPVDDDKDVEEFMIKVNKVFRAIEVCGQILRNRLGSLERNSLEFIYEESLLVSLRFLSVFIRFSEYVREESIRKIKKILEQNPNLPNSKIIRKVESFYLGINYTVILEMLYRISFSLGSAKGRDIYIKVTETNNKPSFCLIQEIIELQFEKKLDTYKIDKLHSEFSKNPVCDRLLKQIILRHCYMHDIGFKDRQKLANILNIQTQVRRSILIASKTTQD